jgi:hypothetical protein
MRGRLFRAVVQLRRAGGQNEWEVSREETRMDRELLRRLLPRIVYGGRKGHRAFLRIWKMGVRPGWPVVRRVVIHIKGFELQDGSFEDCSVQSMASS